MTDARGASTATVAGGAPTTTLALGLEAITAGYGQTTVLRDVSLALRPGRVLALLGPNGAGKTTLIRTAAGIVRPQAGRVLRDGVDVTRDPPHRRADHGMCLVPEGRGVFKTLTVRENLRLFIGDAPREASQERVLDAFPALANRLDSLAGALSGGQQQMLALSRAFATDPQIVLLDEVSMGLAPVVVDEIFEALQLLARRGVAMVLVEQYVSRALAIADDVVLLSKGAVVFEGSPAELDQDAVLNGYLGVDSPVPVNGLGECNSGLGRDQWHDCRDGVGISD